MPSLAGKPATPGFHRQVSRLKMEAVKCMFSESQIRQWPSGYLPASGVAHFLKPGGIPFQDVIDCFREMRDDRQHSLQRDLAADYNLWNQCVLWDFLSQLKCRPENRRAYRKIKKFCARDCALHDEELRALFKLPPYKPPMPPSMKISLDPSFSERVRQQKKGEQQQQNRHGEPTRAMAHLNPEDYRKYFRFVPYADVQEYAMLPVAHVQSPDSRIQFLTFPQLCNVFHTNFDAMTPLQALNQNTGDDLVLSLEFLQALLQYLRRRLDEIRSNEDLFVASARAASDITLRFSSETPVVSFFGNGRLVWFLNEGGLNAGAAGLVRPVQLPWQAARRERKLQRLQSDKQSLFDNFGIGNGITARFPCETLSVGDALRKYRPAIAIVEPHVDRDWLCTIRGFYSVREVLVLGPVDSPAMCSFAYPFLSFGVIPGPFTYWTYNDSLRKVRGSSRVQMPIDAPHEVQGYERRYVDEISACMISPNDCLAISGQHRCLSFIRRECPVVTVKNLSRPVADEKHEIPGPTAADGGDVGDGLRKAEGGVGKRGL